MTGFFSIFDYLFDVLRPEETSNNAYKNIYNSCCVSLGNFFNLVRSDAMTFIFISNNPFCNSSRNC
jgi:hypothetical protein